MKKFSLLALVLLLLLAPTAQLQAAFFIKKSAPAVEVHHKPTTRETIRAAFQMLPHVPAPRTVLRKTKMMFADRYFSGERNEKFTLSLLSALFGIVAYVGLYVILFVMILTESAASFPIMFGADCLFGLAAFVLGIFALKKRQRFKGLAITGLIIGSCYIALLLYLFIIWGLYGSAAFGA